MDHMQEVARERITVLVNTLNENGQITEQNPIMSDTQSFAFHFFHSMNSGTILPVPQMIAEVRAWQVPKSHGLDATPQ